MKLELDISEDEYKTLLTALNHYGHYNLNWRTAAAQKGRRPDGKEFTKEDFNLFDKIQARAFAVQEKVRNAKSN